MCGRYRLKDTDRITALLRKSYRIPHWVGEDGKSRYNIAPSQDCPVIIMDDEGDVLPIPSMMRWGFVPSWDQSEKPKMAPINAQSEKVVENGMFRHAVQHRRCLVPADGFYEWRRLEDGKIKIPFDIHLTSQRPFMMAGIYQAPTESRPANFAILTTRGNDLMKRIHDRMPVILDETAASRWLAPGEISREVVDELTAPFPPDQMEATAISSLVNSPRNDGPELLLPIEAIPESPPPAPKAVQGELF